LVECPIGNPICAFSIQLNLIIFQIVDGNMIISATRRGSEKPRATRALWIALRGVFEKRRRVLRQSASNKPGMGNVDETFQRMAASPQHKRVGPMKRLALIVVLVLVLAAPSVQAQTSPTNATTNSQLGNSNTANALGITTGVGNGRYDNWPATNKHKQPKLDDRRDLHRGNDRDILQCTERPEHEWLRIARRSRAEERDRVAGQARPVARDRVRPRRLHPAAALVSTHRPFRLAGVFLRPTSCATDLQRIGLSVRHPILAEGKMCRSSRYAMLLSSSFDQAPIVTSV
jgi:hypothetical protein